MILAHFATTSGASTALVFGIALIVLGARWITTGDATQRARGVRFLVTGVMVTAVGLVVGFTHTGT